MAPVSSAVLQHLSYFLDYISSINISSGQLGIYQGRFRVTDGPGNLNIYVGGTNFSRPHTHTHTHTHTCTHTVLTLIHTASSSKYRLVNTVCVVYHTKTHREGGGNPLSVCLVVDN